MERKQFMAQLERLLSDIPEMERQEALDYYESYFDDAGPDREAAVIRELGSPGKVAAIIKADLEETNDRYAEYTELGYEDTRMKEHTEMPDKYTAIEKAPYSADGHGPRRQEENGGDPRRSYGDGTGAGDGYGSRRGRRGDNGDGSAEDGYGSRGGRREDNGDGSARNGYTDRRGGPGDNENAGGAGDGYGSGGSRQRDNENAGGAGDGYGSRRGRRRDNRNGGAREEYGPRADRRERGYHAERRRSNAAVILILILLVFLSPFFSAVKGAAAGILGLIVTLVFLPFVIVLALGAAAIGLVLGGIGAVISGIAFCMGNPAAGVLRIGVGCILTAAGLLIALLIIWLAAKLLPRWLRGFTDFCQRIFHGRKRGDET